MIENDPVNNPSHYTNAPFECFELTREYPFAGGNAIKYVFRHRAKNGVEDLKKAAWYLDHATCDELRPRADRHDMTDFGYRCGLVFSKAMAGDERDLDSLGATVWRRMPLFMAGRVSGGLEATPTATRRACAMLRILQHADWQGMAPFWKGMWELAPWIRFGADSRTPRGHTPHIPDGVPSDRRRDSAARRMEPHSHGSVAP